MVRVRVRIMVSVSVSVRVSVTQQNTSRSIIITFLQRAAMLALQALY